jgi:hypothetical protein
MEVIISMGVLSLLFTFAYKTFTGGSESFHAGNWRLLKQKEAQFFLNRLKDLLEKANYAEAIEPGGGLGTAMDTLPIFVKTGANNSSVSCLSLNSGLLYFAVTEPFIRAQPELGLTTNTRGKWTGVSVICQNSKLILTRTGNWDAFNLPYTAPLLTHPASLLGFFDDDTAPEIRLHLDVDDVATFSFMLSRATDTRDIATGTTVEITLGLARMKNNRPTHTMIQERVKARLLRNDHQIRTF